MSKFVELELRLDRECRKYGKTVDYFYDNPLGMPYDFLVDNNQLIKDMKSEIELGVSNIIEPFDNVVSIYDYS